MCGRYATTRSAADLSDLFEAFDETGGDLKPDYNVAPTDRVPIVRVSPERGARVVSEARWGLVPFWASDPRQASRMINARVETVATSRAYASAFEKRRCLVPADGWYEWVRGAGGKQPYFMTPRVMNGDRGMTPRVMNGDRGMTPRVMNGDRGMTPRVMNGEHSMTMQSGLALAGIWGVKGDLRTFAILTTPALGELARVHDRMPLVLPPQRWEEWLTATVSDDLLTPAPTAFLGSIEIRPVGPAVGDVRNDGPDLIRSIDDDRLF
jgi:putative SOS response-associated peptidase YedK